MGTHLPTCVGLMRGRYCAEFTLRCLMFHWSRHTDSSLDLDNPGRTSSVAYPEWTQAGYWISSASSLKPMYKRTKQQTKVRLFWSGSDSRKQEFSFLDT